MAPSLGTEIHMSRPFANRQVEAYLSLIRTTDVLNREIAVILKRWDLTQAQYNVLRIVRGAGADGIPSSKIGERLVALDPDVTRLIDKLLKRSLLERLRSDQDRRLVLVVVTEAGRALLNDSELEAALQAAHHRHFAGFNDTDLDSLIHMLERLRTTTQVPVAIHLAP